jgi:hypothetical protein
MGQVLAGGDSRPITAEELRAIGRMRQAMTQIPVPTLRHTDNPHEYLFFAFMDGSGQDINKPKLGRPTNVGWLYRQAEKLEDEPGLRIGAGYAAGIGSQRFALARAVDGAMALTWADGIEKMYVDFAEQSEKWLRQDPEAQISVAGLSYSRGSVQEAGFHRLVDRYGIADWRDLKFGRDEQGNITIESRLPPLVPPGQVAQVTFLLDPVGTNMPHNYDARLPPSVISRVSTLASTEQRELYRHHAINDPGMSPDGLSLNVPAPGRHSNLGGGNREPGVEILVGNRAADYLNLLSDKPLFEKRPVPQNLSAFTIYQAQGVTAGWGLKIDHDRVRNLHEELANCKIVDPCRDSEPVNRELAGKFEYRQIQFDPREQAQLQGLIAQAVSREQTVPQVPIPEQSVPNLAQQLQQQGIDARGREAEQTRKTEQDSRDDSRDLQPFSDPTHPQHALYANLEQRFQAKGHTLSEEQLSALTRQMHSAGAKPGWQGDVIVHNDKAFAQAAWPPGMRAHLDLQAPAPSVQETMKHFQADQQAMAQSVEMLRQQQATAQEHGHGLSR